MSKDNVGDLEITIRLPPTVCEVVWAIGQRDDITEDQIAEYFDRFRNPSVLSRALGRAESMGLIKYNFGSAAGVLTGRDDGHIRYRLTGCGDAAYAKITSRF